MQTLPSGPSQGSSPGARARAIPGSLLAAAAVAAAFAACATPGPRGSRPAPGASGAAGLPVSGASTLPQAAEATHPLEPLTQAELARAAEILRARPGFPKGGQFALLALQEPPKAEVLAYRGGREFRREARAVILDSDANLTFEAIVDLRTGKVSEWKDRPGIQPMILSSEYGKFSRIVKQDPRFLAALKRRGIERAEDVAVEGWAPGHFLPKGRERARLMRGVCYRRGDGPNFYGRPIEGLIPTVDMNQGKLIELMDSGPVPVAERSEQLDRKHLPAPRAGLKPLVTSQPEGPSFTVSGNRVDWQNWSFRFALHPREGLVLWQVSYRDGDRERPVLYRASLSETVVPYGDPGRAWSWRNAFDEGEYGLGLLSASVRQDAPAHARLFDAVFSDEKGVPFRLPNRVALYERDGGVLWRHGIGDGGADEGEAPAEVRRSRELVLFFVATIGNYDYSVGWVFRQDGSLEAEVGASGIMLPKGVANGADPHAHLVAPRVAAPHHQHFFNYRLDLDVDGPENAALELDTDRAPLGPANPTRNAIEMRHRLLSREREAARDLSPALARKWLVQSSSARNGLGGPTGYALVTGDPTFPYARPEAVIRKRAGFVDHAVWFTRYREGERHAAGEYPNQSRGGDGLPAFIRDDESLSGADLVLWHTFGITHTPRPEEWPVMPVARAGFKLLPVGFFARNPALDAP